MQYSGFGTFTNLVGSGTVKPGTTLTVNGVDYMFVGLEGDRNPVYRLKRPDSTTAVSARKVLTGATFTLEPNGVGQNKNAGSSSKSDQPVTPVKTPEPYKDAAATAEEVDPPKDLKSRRLARIAERRFDYTDEEKEWMKVALEEVMRSGDPLTQPVIERRVKLTLSGLGTNVEFGKVRGFIHKEGGRGLLTYVGDINGESHYIFGQEINSQASS